MGWLGGVGTKLGQLRGAKICYLPSCALSDRPGKMLPDDDPLQASDVLGYA
jgi:hypothetical protein